MINIPLTQKELTALAGFLDAGVKAAGFQSVKIAEANLDQKDTE